MAWVAPAIAAAGLIFSFIGSKKASSAAKDAAAVEAAAEREVTVERVRQLKTEHRNLQGATIASAAGANVKVDRGSPLQLLAEQTRSYAREIDITKRVGATKSAMALQRGSDVASAQKYQAYGNLATGASAIFSMMNQAGMFSSGQPKT